MYTHLRRVISICLLCNISQELSDDERISAMFRMRHFCVEQCADHHSHLGKASPFLPFHAITTTGTALAYSARASPDSAPNLQDYLRNLIPTQPSSRKGDRHWNGESFIHTQKPSPHCQEPGCTLKTDICAVDTAWPQVLHLIVPESLSIDQSPYDRKTALQFPLTFTLPTEGTSSNSGNSAQYVSYSLVGRILFHRKRAHYTAQAVVGDQTFDYDSMAHGGGLCRVGRDVVAATPTPSAVMVVYNRTSVSSVSPIIILRLPKHSNRIFTENTLLLPHHFEKCRTVQSEQSTTFS